MTFIINWKLSILFLYCGKQIKPMPNGELVVFMFLYILLFRLSLVKRFKLIALTI